MKASRLGILSAVVASSCCVLPVVLVLLGLGSLGIGALLGQFHWWFLLTAIGLLIFAWWVYFKEQGRCRAAHCEMEQGKTTKRSLLMASLLVGVFVGLNLYTYTYASRLHSQTTNSPAERTLTHVAIPVEGMTCFTCELTIETSLKRLSGVQGADARVTERVVYVTYHPAQIGVDELMTAINKTGYRASRPN